MDQLMSLVLFFASALACIRIPHHPSRTTPYRNTHHARAVYPHTVANSWRWMY